MRGVRRKSSPFAPVRCERLTLQRSHQLRTDRKSGFGAELERWIRARGIGARELHRRSGYSAGYITQLRQGRRNPSPEAARDLDAALDAGGTLAADAPSPDGAAPVRRWTSTGLTCSLALEGMQTAGLPADDDALAAVLSDLNAAGQQDHVRDYKTICKWASGTSDTYVLGILAEMTGTGIRVIVLPYVNAALAERAPFQRSAESLRDEGVRILLGPGLIEPHQPRSGAGPGDFPWHLALDEAWRLRHS